MKRSQSAVWTPLVTLVFVWGCAESPNRTADEGNPAPGTVTGFVSPIDIGFADATLLRDGREVASVTFRDGVFTFEGVPPGVYRVRIQTLGYEVNEPPLDIVVTPGQVTDIGRVIMIGLADDTPHIQGTIRDAVTLLPVQNVEVRTFCTSGVCGFGRITSNQEGVFRIRIPADFEIRVSLFAEGYEDKTVSVEPVSRGETREIEILLNPQ